MIADVVRGSAVDFAAALDELAVVHRKEQAALLRDASRIAGANTERGRLFVAGQGGEARATWRRSCVEEIELARADGVELQPLLASLGRRPFRAWPKPSRIAFAAWELERAHRGALDLARAWIAEGRHEKGTAILQELLDAGPLPCDRGEVLEALALASESAGRAADALAWYEEAIGVPGSRVRLAIALLALALHHGDLARAEIAAVRLRPLVLSVPGTRARFRTALDRALSRIAASPSAVRGRDSSAARDEIWQLALEGRGAEAEVARAMLVD
jgi:tetratricopeptide (TPR) repeat protein